MSEQENAFQHGTADLAKPAPEVAFYYPWGPPDDPWRIHSPWGHDLGRLAQWTKTMLLFFDGIAFLVPTELGTHPRLGEEEINEPLLELGLLHILRPEALIDETTANALLEFMLELAASDDIKSLKRDYSYRYPMLYKSRGVPPSLTPELQDAAQMVFRELQKHGLVAPEEDPDNRAYLGQRLHPVLWAGLLAMLAQLLRPAGIRLGLDLQPATNQHHLMDSFLRILKLPSMRSSANIVTFDLEQVALDLSLVSLDEALSFRSEHGRSYRAYSRSVREFLRDISLLDSTESAQAFLERREELADAANDLRRLARTWWRRPLATFGLGAAGAAWSTAQGDLPGAAISLLAGIAGAGGRPNISSAYSYIFEAQRKVGRPR